jgi:hypothetical protein
MNLGKLNGEDVDFVHLIIFVKMRIKLRVP